MSAATPAVQPEKRLYYLDWLRVFIIGGVFVAYTILPFSGSSRWICLWCDL